MNQTNPERISAALFLPESVREHLGQQLRTLYGAVEDARPPDRLVALLAQFEAALIAQGEALTTEIRSGLVAALPSLHKFAWSLARNHALAEDLVQDTMLRAWSARHTYQLGTNLEGWLFVIMRNTFYSQARKRRREVEDIDGATAARLSLPPAQADWLDLQDVQLAFEQLPPEQRQALALIVLSGMSYEEAAAMMQCKLGTVKSRINRARERLTHLLGYAVADLGSDNLIRAVTSRTSSAP